MSLKANKNGLVIGTVLMLGSNIIVKGLGFVYRVILVRQIGAEGVGLLDMATPVFSLILVLAGCGVQTSLSQMIAAGKPHERRDLFATACIILFFGSLLVVLLSYLLTSHIIAAFAPDPRMTSCLTAMLPAVVIIGAASALRGLFQGTKHIGSLGMSQNVEQFTRVLVGIWLTLKMISAGVDLETQVTAPAIATVCGEAAGFIFLLVSYGTSRPRLFPSSSERGRFRLNKARALLEMGIPLTVSRLVSAAIMLVQAFMIPICLQRAGWDAHTVTEIYGRFSGVAVSLLHLPGVFTSALSVAVLPVVAESRLYANKSRQILKQRVDLSLDLAASFTVLGMLLLFIFAEQLCGLVFGEPPAADILRILTIGGTFFYLQLTIGTVLQGIGEVRALLINNLAAAVVLIAGIWMLAPLPLLGINGAAIASDVSWVLAFALNAESLRRKGHIVPNWRLIAGKPLIAAAVVLLFWGLAGDFFPVLQKSTGYLELCLKMLAVSGAYLAILYFSGGLRKLGFLKRKTD